MPGHLLTGDPTGAVRTLGRAALLLSVVLLAATLSSCGGHGESDASSPAAWADGLCRSLATWRDSVAAAGEKTGDDLSKDPVREALGDVMDATEGLEDDVQTLGEPPTPSAETAKTEVEELGDRLKAEAGRWQRPRRKWRQQRPEFWKTVSEILVSAMTDELSATVNELEALTEDDQWKQAFDNSDACQTLTSR